MSSRKWVIVACSVVRCRFRCLTFVISCRLRRLFLCRSQDDVSKSDVIVLAALKIDRPRHFFVAVECPTRNTGDFLVINYSFSVLDDGDGSSHQSDVEALPFSRLARQLRRGSDEAIDTSGMVTWRLLNRIVFDLHFITSPQINTTVCVGAAVELDVQLEILELLLVNDFRTVSRADQRPVLHFPSRCRIRVAHLPPGQIFSIEQRDRLSPLRLAFSLEKRRPYGGPCPARSIGSGERSGEGLPLRFSDKDQVV